MDVEIRDQGPAFNPLEVEVGPPGEGEMPAAEGGYGIMITKIVMDDLEYEREGGWNVLRMFKSVRPTSAVAQRD
jgi:anti-sigma regulatory factor (Ser/Thr protein kinase)